MRQERKFFCVNTSKYVPNTNFDVYRPASLNNPCSDSVMFIMESRIAQAEVFYKVERCLIFWPDTVPVPGGIEHRHAVVLCEDPHGDYCRFFRDNGITNTPEPEKFSLVNGGWVCDQAVLGKNVTIMPGAYIGGQCRIGNDVYIGAGVKILGDVAIGDRVVIRENSVIGADGLTTDREKDGKAITMPQFGSVVIEDDVQIGALTVIARGAIDETRIRRGSKIDNCCFISHNVTIGEDTFVVGETIMFGSSTVGNRCLISGNSTLMNVVCVEDESVVGAGAVVTKSVPAHAVVKGNPAR